MSSEAITSSREAVLSRVQKANGGASSIVEAEAAWGEIPREYEQGADVPPEAVIELFADRLRDYDATVMFCAEEALTPTLIGALAEAKVKHLALAEGFAGLDLAQMLRSGIEVVAGDSASATELDAVDAVLTWSTLGIAETGTLVLQGVPGQGTRALTLVPDVHFCVVRAGEVMSTVPEAVAKLEATATLPTTFISGPSATADIEMTRIKGVHGPRFLHVFVVN